MAPATAQPTVLQNLTSLAPATMAPSERVCPPIWGKGTTTEKKSSSASSKKPTGQSSSTDGKGISKAGKEGSSVKGSLAGGSLRSKYSAPEHTDKKSKYESKKRGEKLQKPTYSVKSSGKGTAGKGVESGKAGKTGSMSVRRLPSVSSSAPSSSSSSSLSKGSYPASNIYKMSSGKGQESSSMDAGKGVDAGKGTSVSSKGYVMYDPHCYPQKKSRSYSASQMSKTSESKGSTSGKGSISIEGTKGSSGDESGKGTLKQEEAGKGSSASAKDSSSKVKGQSESYKKKKQSSASSKTMSMLHSGSNKSEKTGKTHSLKGVSKPSYNSEDMHSAPSKEPITKPSPIDVKPSYDSEEEDIEEEVTGEDEPYVL